MTSTRGAHSLHELQVRIIGQVSAIEDPDLLERIEHVIDAYRSGLRAIGDEEMNAILDELRHELDADDVAPYRSRQH